MKLKVVCIVQARMSSKRLPGKVLKEIEKKPMLEHLIERLKKSKLIDKIVIATTIGKGSKPILELAKKCKIGSFTGSEEDVLDRYFQSAKRYKADVIVRVTSDCPLIDPEVVDKIIEYYLDNKYLDYVSNTLVRSFPRGLDTEVFSMKVLERSWKEAKVPYQREHVTPYIYEHPDLFKLKNIEAENNLRRPELRLCVDTEEDLRLIREIYARLHKEGGIIKIEDVIRLLDKHPELRHINANVRQKMLGE